MRRIPLKSTRSYVLQEYSLRTIIAEIVSLSAFWSVLQALFSEALPEQDSGCYRRHTMKLEDFDKMDYQGELTSHADEGGAWSELVLRLYRHRETKQLYLLDRVRSCYIKLEWPKGPWQALIKAE